jgi:ribosomal protein L2
MKYRLPLFICFILSFILINGCSGKVNNSVTFTNLAQGTVYVNFRGEDITLTPGNSVILQEIPKGTYNYDTNFAIPVNALSGSSQGAVSGNLTISAGTRILVMYTSTLTNNGAYVLYATISSSDDQAAPTSP